MSEEKSNLQQQQSIIIAISNKQNKKTKHKAKTNVNIGNSQDNEHVSYQPTLIDEKFKVLVVSTRSITVKSVHGDCCQLFILT